MANYAASNSTSSVGTSQAVAATYKTLVSVTGAQSAPRRGKIYDVLVGTNGTPADNYMQWAIQRVTVPSTGTAITPPPLDPADAAATTVTVANSTTEGTVTAGSDQFYVGVNQRASYRWVAAPGSELVWPATSCAGYVLRVLSGGYTGTATGEIQFQEQ